MQIHDKRRNRESGRSDEQASRDAGSNDSFSDHVWSYVSPRAAAAIGDRGIAASLVTGVQLYLLSSTVGDLIEGKTEGTKAKLVASLMLTGGVVVGFLPKKYA
jgi:hypothetical protein